MLYRCFSLITFLTALLGVSLVLILGAHGARNSEFAVDERLRHWQQLQINKNCPHQPAASNNNCASQAVSARRV